MTHPHVQHDIFTCVTRLNRDVCVCDVCVCERESVCVRARMRVYVPVCVCVLVCAHDNRRYCLHFVRYFSDIITCRGTPIPTVPLHRVAKTHRMP